MAVWRAPTFGLIRAELRRAEAEQARQQEAVEANARKIAEKARDEVAKAREALAGVEYGRTIEVAHQEWRENNVATTLNLLNATRMDLRGWEWRYVNRLCHLDLLTLKGHDGGVNSAGFSPDGTRIVTARLGQYGESVGRPQRRPCPHAHGARLWRLDGWDPFGELQPGRHAHRHRRL